MNSFFTRAPIPERPENLWNFREQRGITPNDSDSFGYSREQWEDLHRWAMRNNMVWNQVHRATEGSGMFEVDRLKMLAAELLRANEDLMTNLLERASLSPNPIVIVKPEAEL